MPCQPGIEQSRCHRPRQSPKFLQKSPPPPVLCCASGIFPRTCVHLSLGLAVRARSVPALFLKTTGRGSLDLSILQMFK
jgi:hypothetical protein